MGAIICRHSEKSRCNPQSQNRPPENIQYRAEAALNGPVTDRRRRASFTRRIRAARASGPARIGWGEGRGAGWAAWATNFRQPPYPPRAGAVYPLSFPQQKSRGDISNYCTLPGTGPALPLSVRCDSGSLGMEEDDLLQPGDQAGARPVRQRGLVGHRLAVAPQQLVQVAPPRRVAEVRMCELVSLLGDPARAVIVQPA